MFVCEFAHEEERFKRQQSQTFPSVPDSALSVGLASTILLVPYKRERHFFALMGTTTAGIGDSLISRESTPIG